MDKTPSPIQTLILWALLARDGGDFQKNIKPELKPEHRKPLEGAGLIEVEKRATTVYRKDGKATRQRANYIALTERGWAWAANHLDAPVAARSTAAAPILQAIMAKLKTHLQSRNLTLAEFICPGSEPHPEPRKEDGSRSIWQRIHTAYSQLAGGRWNVRVKLAALRAELSDVPRDQLDDALLAMEREDAMVLYPLDNPQEIRPEDREAALSNSAGFPRHILYMDG